MSLLRSFLNKHRAKNNNKTHTGLQGPYVGSYSISLDEYPEFFKLYRSALEEGPVHLTEVHQPDMSPILIDLDIRKKLGPNELPPPDKAIRMYPPSLATEFLKIYIRHAAPYVDLAGATCYVTEKPHGRVEKGVVKDGMHMMFPGIVIPPHVQLRIREDALPHLEKLLEDYHSEGAYECFDKCVIAKNNWFLYGSSKPGLPPYTVTQILCVGEDYTLISEPLDGAGVDYLELFSIRNKLTPVPLLKDALVTVEKPRTPRVKLTSGSSSIKAIIPFALLKTVVMFLSEYYYGRGSHEVWKRVNLAIMHVAREMGYPDLGTELAHEFSEQCMFGYDEDQVDNLIAAVPNPGDDVVKFGTLMYFAKMDYVTRLIELIPEEVRVIDQRVLLSLASMTSPEYKNVWKSVCNGSDEAWDMARHTKSRFQYGLGKLEEAAKQHELADAVKLIEAWALCNPREPDPLPTLHDPTVIFDEDYDEPKMRPYDLSIDRITVVTAGMGMGKTEGSFKALRQLSKRADGRKARILIGAPSIALCRGIKKKAKQEAGLDFTLYNESVKGCKLDDGNVPTDYMIDADYVIICIDSIHRIDLSVFDVVVIDEVTSLLQRIQSGFMKRKEEVCASFSEILHNSRHILLMDANADNQLVRRAVAQLQKERERGGFTQPAYWIRNRFIRNDHGPEQVTVHINKNPQLRGHTLQLAIKHMTKLLRQNKRVAMACSTKKSVEAAAFAAEALGKVVGYYTSSDKCKGRLEKDMDNLEEAWMKLDLLIYSPSIPSGVSFSKMHFHVRMAIFDNSNTTAPIDVCLQQLYRVRCTIDNVCDIFVNDTPHFSKIGDISLTQWSAERRLSREDAYVTALNLSVGGGCRTTIDSSGRRVYEKDNMFYHILVGCLIMMGQSLRQFSAILVGALKSDRGATVTEGPVKEPKKFPELEEYEVSCYIVPDAETVEQLEAYKEQGGTLSQEDQQKLFNYRMVQKYMVSDHSLADTRFIDLCVGPADKPGQQEKMQAQLDAFRRYDLLCSTGMETMRDQARYYVQYGRDHMNNGTRISRFFTDTYKKELIKMVEAVELMQAIFPGDTVQRLAGEHGHHSWTNVMDNEKRRASTRACSHEFEVKKDGVYKRFDKYMEDLEPERYGTLVRAFEFDAKKFKGLPDEKQRAPFIQKVLRSAFNLQVAIPQKNMCVSAKLFYELVEKYRAEALGVYNYSFSDDGSVNDV